MPAFSRVAGVVGPVAFVGGWLVAGAGRRGYSPVSDAISELARVGVSSRPLMTAGFLTFGVAVPTFAVGVRREIGTTAAAALTVAGLATLGVAAFPLRDGYSDAAHAACAAVGYVALAATPVLATRSRAGALLSLLSLTALGASTLGPAHGLFQRAGLGVVDAWIVAVALSARSGGVRGSRR